MPNTNENEVHLEQNNVRPKKRSNNSFIDFLARSTMAREFLSSSAAGTFIAYTTFPLEGLKKYMQSAQGEMILYDKNPEMLKKKIGIWKQSQPPGKVIFGNTESKNEWKAYLINNANKDIVEKKIPEGSSFMKILKTINGENSSFLKNRKAQQHLIKDGGSLFKGYTIHSPIFHPYRGSAAFAASIIPTTIIQFSSDAALKSYMPSDSSTLSKMSASAFCGVTGALSATFVENVIVRQQVLASTATTQAEKGPIYAIKDMLKQGYLRPWKSYPLIATRDGIFTFCMLWASNAAAQKANTMYGKDAEIPAKIAVGAFGAAISHPVDTVATKMQATHDKTSALDVCKQTYGKKGLKGFYAGFGWRFGLFVTFTNVIPAVKNYADKQLSLKLKI